jgi:hypothetical protein
MIIGFCLGLTSSVYASEDYKGPFTTQVLYKMCSSDNSVSREKCNIYIQGLMYGLNIQRDLQKKGMPICLPEMTIETARIRMINFIDGVTGGKPDINKDGGDWIAFMSLSAGNICKEKK